MSRYENHVFLPDLHAPYHDETAFACALEFVKAFAPAHVWVLGDVADMYQLSSFDKRPERRHELQSDLDAAVRLLERIREAAPRAGATLLQGNHEDRLRRYLWTRAGELSGLRSLDVRELLHLGRLRYRYIESGQVRHADIIVKHGTMVRSKAAYTAQGELDKSLISGVSGHTHRMGSIIRTSPGTGPLTWLESGCLCSLEPPEYMKGDTPNWAHGFAYGHLEKSGNRFVLHNMPIVNGRVIYGGREIEAPRKKAKS